jgi:HEXXH motif-containing protein
MAQAYDFEPSAERVRLLDQRMRFELGASLNYLADQLEPRVAIPREAFSAFLKKLHGGPVSPLAFATYSDVVFTIDADDLAEAARLLELLCVQPMPKPGLQIRELGTGMSAEDAARYVRQVATDPEISFNLVPPPDAAAQSAREKIQKAMELLDAADPALAGEIRELIREIVLCAGDDRDAAAFSFDGASSPMLWGTIVINATRPGDEVGMAQMLAHESAHNLLFGLCPDEPLLTNDREARYPSPLRDDLRPLEGIYHATFVTARMHRATRRLAESGLLSAEQTTLAEKAAAWNEKSFAAGMATLDQHAELTGPGKAILESARAYMQPFLG